MTNLTLHGRIYLPFISVNTFSMSNVDISELKKFANLKDEWWDLDGKLKTLHDINSARISFILEHTSVINKAVLDVGCGGGILTEALAKNSPNSIMGIDLEKNALDVAQSHAKENNLEINYQNIAIENLDDNLQFDVITCLEMLEHVPDPAAIVYELCQHLKPEGYLFLSTINRNLKAYLHTIIGAEYLLKIIPKQTHDYDKYIKPSELAHIIRNNQLTLLEFRGLNYNPLSRKSSLSDNIDVNYLCVAKKE